jgi:hypothetical protein
MSTAEERALRRREWPVRRFVLGREPGDDLRGATTAEERLEMMWPLALEAWGLTGRPLPSYDRSAAPVRCLQLPRPGLASRE